MVSSKIEDALILSGGKTVKEKIMRWNYKKAFVTVVILAVVLALVSAIAVPLSLSQQIRDAHAWGQTAKAERLQSGEAKSDHDGDREHGDWGKNITPLNAGHFVLFGGLIVLWLALGAVYWLLVMAWLYKSAVCEGMNKSLWPILGLFFNLFAVFAFLIVRDRPNRTKPEGASAQ